MKSNSGTRRDYPFPATTRVLYESFVPKKPSRRIITGSGGERLSYRVYAPFGDPITNDTISINPPDRLRFTGHERDLETSRYYMHARHFGGMGARFSSLDTHPANPNAPQSFNRYAYALGNPLKYVDPNGENPAVAAIWPLVEIGLTAYDVHDTYQVLSDPDASGLRKTVAVGLTAVGLVTIGGGYTKLGEEATERVARLAANFVTGKAFEQRALAALDAIKNTKPFLVEGIGRTIPDTLTGATIVVYDAATNTLRPWVH